MLAIGKTWMAKKEVVDEAGRDWFVVDADGHIVGRLATQIATILMGKHKPTYTPHVDTGDFVVVINASKIRVTGTRLVDKKYYSHSLHNGGLRTVALNELLVKDPERVIRQAVWGMIPKGPLGRKMIKKLKVYGGIRHDNASQNPQPMQVAL